MQIGWNFPSNNYGQLTGIGEAGIETFKGAPYSSLAREICQNSLDARLDHSKPVIVEFTKFYIDPEQIPGMDELKDNLKRCKDFWESQGNKKTVSFFNKALSVINSDLIPVLRISDFNTTGLTGSNKEYNTPWQNLVKSSGVSDKGGTAGGSFGIGKSAPFACSELRTIFYSTLDKDGLQAAQGVARLVSFLDCNNEITQGTGYYGEKTKNTPIHDKLSMDDNFERIGITGTDVFVIGFMEDNQWEKEMIKSVLDGFLISIFQENLVVKIGENGISKDTLPIIIDKFKNEAKLAHNYYQVLTSEESEKIVTDFAELGEIELYVLMGANLHRKVLVSRSSGMKIFDKQNISSTIHFAGILILKGETINAYFREMETPQHNAWEPDRYVESDKVKKAKDTRTKLFRYIKDSILEMGRNTAADEIDAEGVGEYLPDELLSEQLQNKSDTDEAITDKTKNIEIKIIEKANIPKGFEKTQEKNINEETDSFGDEEETGEDIGYQPTGDSNDSQGGKGTPIAANANKQSENEIKKEVQVSTSHVRLFVTDNIHNRYNLTLMPEKAVTSGYVQLKLAGEQSNIVAKVKEAYLDGDHKKPLKCFDGKIFISNLKQKQKMNISFVLDYSENCSMEVSLYGYSS